MSCQPKPPAKSPVQRLNEAATAFAQLEPTASKQMVTDTYLEYRQALFNAMIVDIDPTRYDVSWRIIKNFGDKEVSAIQEVANASKAYAQALEHLQHLVKESHTYVPWG